jgi:hypothetical protein
MSPLGDPIYTYNRPYPREYKEDYTWLREREHRHRQAHYYNLGVGAGISTSICRRYDIALRDLTRYKEYSKTPNNACPTCAAWELHKCMEGLAK